jgi:hypothetical protein
MMINSNFIIPILQLPQVTTDNEADQRLEFMRQKSFKGDFKSKWP